MNGRGIMQSKHERDLPRVAISPETKRVIKTIAMIRDQTQTEVVEEYLRRSGIIEECVELKRKNGWVNREE